MNPSIHECDGLGRCTRGTAVGADPVAFRAPRWGRRVTQGRRSEQAAQSETAQEDCVLGPTGRAGNAMI